VSDPFGLRDLAAAVVKDEREYHAHRIRSGLVFWFSVKPLPNGGCLGKSEIIASAVVH